MLKERFAHPLTKSKEDYYELINKLENHFASWTFVNMGSLNTIKESLHYHLKSKNNNEKGIVEITLAPSLNGNVELKVADNRMKDWSENALKELSSFLKSDSHE